MECHCDNLLERLHLLTLQNRLLHFDALFLINILPRVECCLPALLTASIWNIRNFNMFTCSSASASLLPKVQFVKLQVFLEALVRILKPKIIHLSLILLFTLLFLVSFILNQMRIVLCFLILIATVLKAITCSCFLKMTIDLLFIVSLPLHLRR